VQLERLDARRQDQPDPDDPFSGALSRGIYLNVCGVPAETRVDVCVAVAEGKAVSVTVAMSPANVDMEKCVAGRVRQLPFPSHPRSRVVRVSF